MIETQAVTSSDETEEVKISTREHKVVERDAVAPGTRIAAHEKLDWF